MKKIIPLFIILIATQNLHSQYQCHFELDTITYWSEGKTDSSGSKQGYWKYYCDQKINKIYYNDLANLSDTLTSNSTNCYKEGEYKNGKKIGEWRYHIGSCYQFHGTIARETRTENYQKDGSVNIKYSIMFWSWEYTINRDSTELNGKVNLYYYEDLNDLIIKGEKINNELRCRFETIEGVVVDEFELGFLDAKCQIVFGGHYDWYIKKRNR